MDNKKRQPVRSCLREKGKSGSAGSYPALLGTLAVSVVIGKAHQDAEFIENFLAEEKVTNVLPLHLGWVRTGFLSFCHN